MGVVPLRVGFITPIPVLVVSTVITILMASTLVTSWSLTDTLTYHSVQKSISISF